MPGINVRFNDSCACPKCKSNIATDGSYSTVTDAGGAIILFDDAHPPENLTIVLECPNGHRVAVPEKCEIEWWFMTPPDALKAAAVAVAQI